MICVYRNRTSVIANWYEILSFIDYIQLCKKAHFWFEETLRISGFKPKNIYIQDKLLSSKTQLQSDVNEKRKLESKSYFSCMGI